MGSNKRVYNILSTALLIMCLSVSGCRKEKEARDSAMGPSPVKTMNVNVKTISTTLEYVGDIRAFNEADVYPKVSGKIIEKVKEEGSAVSKGETIAYIDRDETGLKFEKAPVESPMNGIVGRVYVDIGESVSQSRPVARVIDMSMAKVEVQIPEKYIPGMALGLYACISVDAYNDRIFGGKISKISPLIDRDTRAASVEITVDNSSGELYSGMFANVTISVDRHDKVPVLIKEALVGRGKDLGVFVIENGKAYLRNVTTGIKNGSDIEVTSGLSGGESVVVMGQEKLMDGSEVAVDGEDKK